MKSNAPAPVFSILEENDTIPVKKRSRKQIVFVVITLALMGFFIIRLKQAEMKSAALAFTTVVDVKYRPADKPVPKPTLKEAKKEFVNPARAVRAAIRWRKNLVGETILEGTLTNTSKAVNIKDAVLVVTWLSKSNREFATTNYPIPEVLGAKTTIPYKLKVKAPGKYAALRISVESASVML